MKQEINMDDRTLMNTTLEKALPGFLLLIDLASQIRLGKVISKGGNGILYEGTISDPDIRRRAPADTVAVKHIECKPLLFLSGLSNGNKVLHPPRRPRS